MTANVADGKPPTAAGAADHRSKVVIVTVQADVGHARRLAVAMAAHMGFDVATVQCLATAVTELSNNLVAHADGGGRLSLIPVRRGGYRGIELHVADEGPGITDIDAAMTDGFSTNKGLGSGLGSCRRLMHEFAIESVPGQGTRVTARIWLSKADHSAANRPLAAPR